jgi:iron complex outermembrane receptor protein
VKKYIAAAVCGCLSVGVAAETTNETTKAVVKADRIVVTATRVADDVRTVQGNPTVITAQDIADGHYTSVPEALQKEAGIFFKNYTDNPSQASVDMRGFGENSHGRVLVLVDGRRLNEADMATLNWSAVPLNAVERIEVLDGPAAVLYGDNAVGGVINIITAKGTDEPTFSLSASAGSHDAFTQDATVSGKIDGLGYTAASSHQSGDGYRDRSRYDNTSVYAGLNLTPNEYFSGSAAFSAVDRQYQLPGALSAVQDNADRRQSVELSDVKDTQYNTQLGGVFTPDDKSTFAIDVGHRRLDQIATLNREFETLFGFPGTYYDANKDTWTVEPRYTLTLPVGNAENETTVGLDWRNETILIDRFGDLAHSAKTADAKIEQETLDFYLNDRLFFLDDKLILNAGARTGQSRFKAKDSAFGTLLYEETKNRHENAYTVGLTALPSDKVKLYTKYDEFYRFPFTDEQALYYGFSGFDAVTDLEPEKGQNIEAGGSYAPTDNSELSMTVYRMEMQNEIRFNPTLFANENLPDTLHQGINMSAHCKPTDLLRFGLIYNYTEAEFDAGPNNGDRIPWVPRNQLRATVDVMPMDGLTLTAGATYTGEMFAINDNGNNGDTQGGYTLFDLLLSYESVYKKIEWNVFAGIDNLFGKEYDLFQVSNAAGTTINHYPSPERTYKAGLGVRF